MKNIYEEIFTCGLKFLYQVVFETLLYIFWSKYIQNEIYFGFSEEDEKIVILKLIKLETSSVLLLEAQVAIFPKM